MGFEVRAPAELEPGALGEILANVDLGTKRWRRKVQILQVVGRWGGQHEIGYRSLSDRTGISYSLLEQLLVELVTDRVLLVDRVGRGTRATVWRVNPAIDRWRSVPWLRDVHAVALWAFHVEQPESAEPRQRRVYGPPSERRARQRSEGDAYAERNGGQRSEGGANARRNESTAFRGGGVERALDRLDSQEEVPTSAGTTHTPPGTRGPGASGPSVERAPANIRAAVLHRAIAVGGKKFLNGATDIALGELVAEVGADEVLARLVESPDDLGVPRLVEWLTDQAAPLDPDLVAALEARATPPEPEPAAPPEDRRPALREHRAAPFDPNELTAAADALRTARQNIKQTHPTDPVGGRIITSTGGATS